MAERARWEKAARRIARAVVCLARSTLALTVIERVAPRYARLALHAGGGLLPRAIRTFPERVADLIGDSRSAEETRRLIEARLAFLLVRALVTQLFIAYGPAEAWRRLGAVSIDGGDHLEAALDARRGVILVSAHLGLPLLVDLAVEHLGVPVTGVGRATAEYADVLVGRDVWDRARAMQQLREELGPDRACLLLADARHTPYPEAKFLGGRVPVAPGAFVLAQITRCPLLPVFAVYSRNPPRFRVEFGPALEVPDRSLGARPTEAIADFVRRYEALAALYPDNLFAAETLFTPRRGDPLVERRAHGRALSSRESGGRAPRSRSARR